MRHGLSVSADQARVSLSLHKWHDGDSIREIPPPERTAPAELAALRDFTAIAIRSDVAVGIVSVADGTLTIRGYGNSGESRLGSVRIGMPELDRLDSEFLISLVIRNFASDTMALRTEKATDIVLENNRKHQITGRYHGNNARLQGSPCSWLAQSADDGDQLPDTFQPRVILAYQQHDAP